MSAYDYPGAAEFDQDLERARLLAHIMDSQFNFMGIEFGADAIMGLVPGLGDTAAMVIACYPIHLAKKHRLGADIQVRMAKNVALDWAVGLVPILGDMFDVAFKANLKNYKLLEEAAAERRRRR